MTRKACAKFVFPAVTACVLWITHTFALLLVDYLPIDEWTVYYPLTEVGAHPPQAFKWYRISTHLGMVASREIWLESSSRSRAASREIWLELLTSQLSEGQDQTDRLHQNKIRSWDDTCTLFWIYWPIVLGIQSHKLLPPLFFYLHSTERYKNEACCPLKCWLFWHKSSCETILYEPTRDLSRLPPRGSFTSFGVIVSRKIHLFGEQPEFNIAYIMWVGECKKNLWQVIDRQKITSLAFYERGMNAVKNSGKCNVLI